MSNVVLFERKKTKYQEIVAVNINPESPNKHHEDSPMSTLITEQDFHKTDNSRFRMIVALRAALNAAELGENEVTILYDNLEITWNYEDGEFFVIG